MNDYKLLLALSYFKQYKREYILSELMKILGIGVRRLDDMITQMVNENLLEYENYLLQITEKGLTLLVSQNMQGYDESDNEYLNFKINPHEAWAIDMPYVPKKFMTKI